MKEKIDTLWEEIQSGNVSNLQELEAFRIKYLGSKGVVKELFGELKNVPNDQKKEVGQLLNTFRMQTEGFYEACKERLSAASAEHSKLDYSRPGNAEPVGSRHPLSLVRSEIIDIFSRIGYTVSEGPEIEDDWHNFSALNFPPEHPARDMQDTFFIQKGEEEIALRTHTSSVQVRVMENQAPPIRTISPGRVYRNEAIKLGNHFIEKNIGLVYGGGKIGMMGILADTMIEKNGIVIGFIPGLLRHEEVAHTNITEMIVTKTMSKRKVKISKLVDGYIALPGGFGTLDEIFEALTLGQLGIENKPVGILNTNGFFNHLIF